MTYLIIGLVLFIGIHSIRIVAAPMRAGLIERFGENGYKGIYTLVSFAGLILIIYGYGQTRTDPTDIWYPAMGLRHLAYLLTWVAFILLAANDPSPDKPSKLKQWLGHPMIIGVKVWAFAHLLVNGRLGDIVLFGTFLVWAIVSYASYRRRDRAEGKTPVRAPGWGRDIPSLVAGTVIWIVFAMFLHPWLIGVRVMG